MSRLRQQLTTQRIINELPYLAAQDIDQIQKAIDDIKKVRNIRTCKPAKDHDQVVEAYVKLQLNDNTKERENAD